MPPRDRPRHDHRLPADAIGETAAEEGTRHGGQSRARVRDSDLGRRCCSLRQGPDREEREEGELAERAESDRRQHRPEDRVDLAAEEPLEAEHGGTVAIQCHARQCPFRLKLYASVMLDPRRLALLREVVRHGSFSKAAQALFLTQPAVSRQVAKLEREVGVRLLERTPAGLRLTDAGRVAVDRAEAIAGHLAAAEAELAAIATMSAGRLRMCAFPTVASTRCTSPWRKTTPSPRRTPSGCGTSGTKAGSRRCRPARPALPTAPVSPPVSSRASSTSATMRPSRKDS